MTSEEITFCNLVQGHILDTFGYFVVGLDRPMGDQLYVLRTKRLGDPESDMKRFPIFPDQMTNSVATGQLPESLLRDFPLWLN